jgi:hypothetical protein
MLEIKSLEGTIVAGVFRPIHPTLVKVVRLHKVEEYGIWIESQELTNSVLSRLGVSSVPETPVVFLPWSEVGMIVSTAEGVALSEKAFGL